MKKLLVLALLAFSTGVHAQLKNMKELIEWGQMPYNKLESILKKSYWKKIEEGKMDSFTYIRWIPENMNEKNMGENVMPFVRKRDKPVNYIVFQTINKPLYETFLAEIKKSGFEFRNSENKPDKKTDFYARGMIGVSIIVGKEKPEAPLSYIFGVKMLEGVPMDPKQLGPKKLAPAPPPAKKKK